MQQTESSQEGHVVRLPPSELFTEQSLTLGDDCQTPRLLLRGLSVVTCGSISRCSYSRWLAVIGWLIIFDLLHGFHLLQPCLVRAIPLILGA